MTKIIPNRHHAGGAEASLVSACTHDKMVNTFGRGPYLWSNKSMKGGDISEFKAKCLALLEQVRQTKIPIRVTPDKRAGSAP